jgi:low temperature requirement protein LtrA
VAGASFAHLTWNAVTVVAFCVCIVGSIAMWWIYFNIGAERARRLIAASPNPGAIGRLAYTYLHVVIVAGIIVCAVSDEIVLKHPSGHNDLATSLTLTGGPALFLFGCLLFKWVTAGWPPLSHMVGTGLLMLLLAANAALSTLMLGVGSALVLLVVAIWETASLKGERATLKRPV